jgi:hypothetical protein
VISRASTRTYRLSPPDAIPTAASRSDAYSVSTLRSRRSTLPESRGDSTASRFAQCSPFGRLPLLAHLPMLGECSSSPRQMPPRSTPPMKRPVICRRLSNCVACSLASRRTRRHGPAPEPSQVGSRCQKRPSVLVGAIHGRKFPPDRAVGVFVQVPCSGRLRQTVEPRASKARDVRAHCTPCLLIPRRASASFRSLQPVAA